MYILIPILQKPTQAGLSDQLLDKTKGLLAILVNILLVRVGVVAVATVRVGGVAVGLDDGGVGGRALETALAGRELELVSFKK